MAKKYYWLKLKADFFTSRAMKKLRRIAGGDTYTIIYLKLQLLSLNDEGLLHYEGVEPTFYEEMALALDEEPDNLRATLLFLENVGLLEKKNETEYLLTEVPFIIGSETDKAALMRRKREKDKAALTLEGGNNVTAKLPAVTNCYTEKEREKEKEKELEKSESKPRAQKHKYGEFQKVLLTDEELDKLKNEYGEAITEKAVAFLDEYIAEKAYKSKSHYLAIRRWVIDAINERESKAHKPAQRQSRTAEELDVFYNMAHDWAEQ